MAEGRFFTGGGGFAGVGVYTVEGFFTTRISGFWIACGLTAITAVVPTFFDVVVGIAPAIALPIGHAHGYGLTLAGVFAGDWVFTRPSGRATLVG